MAALATSIARRWPVRRALVCLGLGSALLAGYARYWNVNLKRFSEVRPGVFYRLGQPTEQGLLWLVRREHVRTVLSTQVETMRLYRGPFDLGRPDGELESDLARRWGVQHIQWPMGDEPYWPWPTPWQFEAFFDLCDDPLRWPIAVHCQGGRHRTGTLSALFRLEYDRWPIERVLEEMYSYHFGGAIPIQELNLRTYWRRPQPDAAAWQALSAGLTMDPARPPSEFTALVQQLRSRRGESDVEAALASWIDRHAPFAMCLAQRLIVHVDDPLVPAAVRLARATVSADLAGSNELAAGAALLADHGDLPAQQLLQDKLAASQQQAAARDRYSALVAGVSNRYTSNRVPYLALILEDTRPRSEPEARGSRFCDTAVARLAVIAQQNLLSGARGDNPWDAGRQAAQAWLAQHPDRLQLAKRVPPGGLNRVRGEAQARHQEDLSRMR